MAFYSFVALMLVGGRLRLNLWLGAGAVSALLLVRILSDAAWLRWLANPILLEFGFGVVVANLRGPIARLGPIVGASLLALGAAMFTLEFAAGLGDAIGNPWTVVTGGDLTSRIILYGLPAVVVVAGAVAFEPWARGRAARLLASGGDVSYAIYLTHPLAMQQLGLGWRALHLQRWPLAIVAAGVFAALFLGLIVHRVIEKPILRDLKRLRWDGRASARHMAVGGDPA
jgi:peptidoglycan/LPS O-acetylase OafA/YrhL